MAVPDAPKPENTFVFETDTKARHDPRSQSARSYLISVARHCPNGVGEAVVKKIEYRKSSETPNHEFLLCYVEDRNVPARQAVIRIDRSIGDQAVPDTENRVPLALPRAALLSLDATRSSSPSLFGRAIDVFTITCDINASRSDAVLSTLIFDDDADFTADEAAMVCQIVSERADEYNVFGHQCYWYAGVIYKIIQETYLGRFKEMLAADNKRKGKGWNGLRICNSEGANRFIPLSDTSQELAQTHRDRWDEWMTGIEVDKKEKKRKDEQRQQELDRKQGELDRKDEVIQMLQRELADKKGLAFLGTPVEQK